MKAKLKIGLVGAGANMRARHIPGLLATGVVELTAVCNRRRESAERAAREFGIPRVHERWEDLVADEGIEAVVIGTWPNLHAPVTLGALAAGKHVLCEARMAMDAAEARAMLAAGSARPDLVKQLVPAPPTLEWDVAVIRLLRDGFLGRVLAVDVRDAGAFMDADSPLHWRQDRALSGLNVLTLGIWYEVLLRWGFEAEEVQAVGHTFVDRRPDPDAGELRDVAVPDHLEAAAVLRGGARLRMGLSAVCGLAPASGIWLFGDEGTLQVSPAGLRGARRGAKELEPVPVPASERRGWRVEADFVASVREGLPVTLTTFEDGVRYMAFTEAVARGMETKTVVSPVEEGA